MKFGCIIRFHRVVVVTVFLLIWIYILFPKRLAEEKQLVNLKDLLMVGIEIAMKGGFETVSVLKKGNFTEYSKGKTKEGANDPVTTADLRSHCVMYYQIKNLFPFIDIVSEENLTLTICNQFPKYFMPIKQANLIKDTFPDEFVAAESITVWIDPLDATQEYTEHLFEYVTTMVCIAVNGKPIIGIIHKPFEKDESTFWAWNGKNMSENLQNPIKHINNNNNAPIIIVSRSHAGKIKQIVESAFSSKAKIVQAGGAGYKVLQLIKGGYDAYIHSTNIKKWDVCAGDAILQSIGGRMSTLSNEDIDYSSHSNPINRKGVLATTSSSYHSMFLKNLNAYEVYHN